VLLTHLCIGLLCGLFPNNNEYLASLISITCCLFAAYHSNNILWTAQIKSSYHRTVPSLLFLFPPSQACIFSSAPCSQDTLSYLICWGSCGQYIYIYIYIISCGWTLKALSVHFNLYVFCSSCDKKTFPALKVSYVSVYLEFIRQTTVGDLHQSYGLSLHNTL
jgi:hypothetical protein